MSSYTYLFILGRIPELSILELNALFASQGISATHLSYTSSALIATTERPLNCEALMQRLGGTIKIAEILNECIDGKDLDADSTTLKHVIENNSDDLSQRVTYGFSSYHSDTAHGLSAKNIEHLGLTVKKLLKNDGRSVRFIAPKRGENFLSSVTVEKQGLLKKNGCELLFFQNDSHLKIAKTIAVQPFEEFSHRDWDRPQRSMDVGLLPPKIARMMINISGAQNNQTLLDPFCGFGTVLQEALLLGIPRALGSDLSPERISDAKKNIAWLTKELGVNSSLARLTTCSAATLSKHYSPLSIDAIITEPFLGPMVTKSGVKNLSSIIADLEKLYLAFFREAHRVLKKDGVIVIVMPCWIDSKKKITWLPFLQKILSIGFSQTQTSEDLSPLRFKNVTQRNSILIVRSGQHVGRELFVFKKK